MKIAVNSKTNKFLWLNQITRGDSNLICPLCKGDVICKEGNQISKHLAHKNLTNCKAYNRYKKKKKHTNEGLIHKMAKLIILNRLNNNEEITIFNHCCRCYDIIRFHLSLSNFQSIIARAEKTVKVNDSTTRPDISLWNNDEVLRCIIEIKDSNKTENRPEPWFELDARSIIKNQRIMELRKRECHSENCLSTQDIAKKLGYYVLISDESTNLSEMIIRSCKSQPYYVITYEWSLYCRAERRERDSHEFHNAWKDFIARKICLLCSQYHETVKPKPYCQKCYKSLKMDDIDLMKEKIVHPQPDLREKYEWLETLPKLSYDNHEACIECQNTNNSKMWFYGIRQMCRVCINTGGDRLCKKYLIKTWNSLSPRRRESICNDKILVDVGESLRDKYGDKYNEKMLVKIKELLYHNNLDIEQSAYEIPWDDNNNEKLLSFYSLNPDMEIKEIAKYFSTTVEVLKTILDKYNYL